MYLFGGGASSLFDGLWMLNLQSLRWQTFETVGEQPIPRAHHTLTVGFNLSVRCGVYVCVCVCVCVYYCVCR
jgi:Galactose oxidase, central domain